MNFFLSFVIHLFLWRTRKPKSDMQSLLKIFITLPLFLIAIEIVYLNLGFLNISLLILVNLSLSCAYIQTYPALEGKSPSIQIVHLLGQSKNPLTRQEIENSFSKDTFIIDKIKNLINDDLIEIQDDKIFLKKKGRRLANLFCNFRKLL